jgi:hypothetical protein
MKYIKFLLLIAAFAACTDKPSVLFDQPQPPNGNNLDIIPKRLQGTYQSRKDSSMLSITDKLMIRLATLEFKVHKNKLDSGLVLRGDTLVDIKNNEKFPVKINGDSISAYSKYTDTLFDISKKNIIRKFKGYYFLNLPYDKEWEVKKISLARGILTISSIAAKEDIDNLSEVKDTPADTLVHHVAPTRKQFRRFVKNEGFVEGEEFVKVR